MKQINILLTEDQVKLYHALAREIALGYATRENILKGLSITEQDYDEITQVPVFQRILKQYVAEWTGANNTAKRVRAKAQWAAEEAIPYMFQSLTDINEPLSARVQAFQALSRVGQLEHQETSLTSDKSFRLEININSSLPTITINSTTPSPNDPGEQEDPRIKSGDHIIEHEPLSFTPAGFKSE